MANPRGNLLGLSINAAAQHATQKGILTQVNLGSAKNYGPFGGRASEQETRGMHQWLPQTRVMFDSDAVSNASQAANWVVPPLNPSTGQRDYTGYSLYDNLKKIRYDIYNLFSSSTIGVPAVTVETISNADGTLTISPTQGLTVASLNLAHANSWTAAQAFAAGLTGTTGAFSGAVSGAAGTFSGSISGSSIQSTGGFLYAKDTLTGFRVKDSLTIELLPNNNLQSPGFTTGVRGWQLQEDGDIEANNVTVRGALNSSVIHYNQAFVTSGSQYIAKSAGKLRTAVTTYAATSGMPVGLLLSITRTAPTSFNLDIEDPEGTTHASAQLFAVSDILWLKDGASSTWLTVSSVSDQTTFWRYVCAYASGTQNVTYPSGSAVTNFGQSGQGFLYMTADNADAPFYSVRTHAGAPWTTQTEVGRFGMMRNAFGVSGAYHGFGVGDYAGGNYLKYDTNGGFLLSGGGGVVTMTGSGLSIVPSTSYLQVRGYGFTHANASLYGALGYVSSSATGAMALALGIQQTAGTRTSAVELFSYANSAAASIVMTAQTAGPSTASLLIYAENGVGAFVSTGIGVPFGVSYGGVPPATLYVQYGGGTTAGFAPTFASGFQLRADTSVTAADYLTASVTLNIKTANTNSNQGFEVYLVASHTSGVVNSVPVLFGTFENSAAGTVGSVTAVSGGLVMGNGSGALTDFKAFYANSVKVGTAGTVTNYYGLYIDTFSSNITNKWGIYQVDATGLNFLAGKLGIGSASIIPESLSITGAFDVRGGAVASMGSLLATSTAALGPVIIGNTDSALNSTFNGGAVREQVGAGGWSISTSPATAVGAARTFTSRMSITLLGAANFVNALTVTGGFGVNGAAAQTAAASGGALAAYAAGANGLGTGANMSALHALVVAMRAALVANGIMS